MQCVCLYMCVFVFDSNFHLLQKIRGAKTKEKAQFFLAKKNNNMLIE